MTDIAVGTLVLSRTLSLTDLWIGSAQKDDDLCQKIDEWIRHEEALAEMTARASATPTAQEKEKEESEIQRRFMFARLSQKRTAAAANGEDEEEVVVLDEDATNAEVAQAAAQVRKKRKTTRAASSPAPFENGLVEVGASIDRMGTTLSGGMRDAVRELNVGRQGGAAAAAAGEAKFKELREELAQESEAAAHHRELMDAQRLEDLARAENQRREDRERQEKQREEDRAEDHQQKWISCMLSLLSLVCT
jgi:hypothetical protein